MARQECAYCHADLDARGEQKQGSGMLSGSVGGQTLFMAYCHREGHREEVLREFEAKLELLRATIKEGS